MWKKSPKPSRLVQEEEIRSSKWGAEVPCNQGEAHGWSRLSSCSPLRTMSEQVSTLQPKGELRQVEITVHRGAHVGAECFWSTMAHGVDPCWSRGKPRRKGRQKIVIMNWLSPRQEWMSDVEYGRKRGWGKVVLPFYSNFNWQEIKLIDKES